MNISTKRIFSTLVLAGLAILPAIQAETVQGRFHLGVAAYLGESLLRPGDYNISLLQSSSGLKHVAVVGKGGRAYAMPMVVEQQYSSGTSSLRLVEVGGNFFVKEFRSENTGKIYSFGVSEKVVQSQKTLELAN